MHYTESHEWLSLKGKEGTVGITEYAQKELGEVVYVALPKVGQSLKKGEEACVLESTKAASDVYVPVSGTVTEVNHLLQDNPSLINTHPETDGWLFKLSVSNAQEFRSLLTESDYTGLVSS